MFYAICKAKYVHRVQLLQHHTLGSSVRQVCWRITPFIFCNFVHETDKRLTFKNAATSTLSEGNYVRITSFYHNYIFYHYMYKLVEDGEIKLSEPSASLDLWDTEALHFSIFHSRFCDITNISLQQWLLSSPKIMWNNYK